MTDRATKTTWKDVELFLMEWKAEMNRDFEEIRECLRPNSFKPVKMQALQFWRKHKQGCGSELSKVNSAPWILDSGLNLVSRAQTQELEIQSEPNGKVSGYGVPRMTTFEESFRRMEQIQKEFAASINIGLSPTLIIQANAIEGFEPTSCLSESAQLEMMKQKEGFPILQHTGSSTPSTAHLEVELKLEANSGRQALGFLCTTQEIKELKSLKDMDNLNQQLIDPHQPDLKALVGLRVDWLFDKYKGVLIPLA